jgi:retron-type reverse transcriptase
MRAPSRQPSGGLAITDFERICDFQNLYKAHAAARCGKQGKFDVIHFEINLSENICSLQRRLQDGSYKPGAYRQFYIFDPKVRLIHAPLYKDVVVQHCVCDQVLAPLLENRLIYDNAACRIGKGTHFAIYRLTGFLRSYYKQHGAHGYFLKCDFRKYFANIDHDILKQKLKQIVRDKDVLSLLFGIIDSYESESGKGLPLGNQTSQWFALYYLDAFDRLVKEQMHVKYYTRYMDDCILLHESKEFLSGCLAILRRFALEDAKLVFNDKTQIFPISNGVNYLGFHFYLTETGKVIRKVRNIAKNRFKRSLNRMKKGYAAGTAEYPEIRQRLCSYLGHLKHRHTYRLRQKALREFVLVRDNICKIKIGGESHGDQSDCKETTTCETAESRELEGTYC